MSDYAESLEFKTFVVFLFCINESYKSALSVKVDSFSLHAVICFNRLQKSLKEFHKKAALMEGSPSYSVERNGLLNSNIKECEREQISQLIHVKSANSKTRTLAYNHQENCAFSKKCDLL